MRARLVNAATEQVIQEFDLTEHIEASGEGWQNESGETHTLTGVSAGFDLVAGETLAYEVHPIPYKRNGISGYISVEITGKCLFFYVYDGEVMYDEIGEFSAYQKQSK